MEALWQRVEQAFEDLESRAGFEVRAVQRQMARYVVERLTQHESAVVEAPTGVGKSLAVLLPAIAHCLQSEPKKRVVIATYTNVLAQQYWYKDLPLAVSLFPEKKIEVALAMGRTRYACRDAIHRREIRQSHPELLRMLHEWLDIAQEGTEAELNTYFQRKGVPDHFLRGVWEQIAVPSVCRARACKHYTSCFYYTNRQQVAQAQLVLTNHAVVLTDAFLRQVSEGKVSLLDSYDYLVIDEAHDFVEAARSALEVTLSRETVAMLVQIASQMSNQIGYAVEGPNPPVVFLGEIQEVVQAYARASFQAIYQSPYLELPEEGVITCVAPTELLQIGELARVAQPGSHSIIQSTVNALSTEIETLFEKIENIYEAHRSRMNEKQREAVSETLKQYTTWFSATAQQLRRLAEPSEGVCWLEPEDRHWQACYRPLEVAEWLRTTLFEAHPTLMMSATLTVDGRFDFFLEQVGLETPHRLGLPTVFDYTSQCALYLPPVNTIPQPPASARASGAEHYYNAVAQELARVLQATQGRALVLFASRAEMEQVRRRMPALSGIPIYMQGELSNAELSRRFREQTHSVLFGLRSFWTGFDAPGETLVNLVIVRIPFEVPTTPVQRARQAKLLWQGKDPFRDWSLPMVKQQIRQGFGRLIRQRTDRGVVCLLDPRFRTQWYGVEIIHNLPSGISMFESINAAVAHLKLNGKAV